jgi:hypothetical protein
LHNTHTPIGCYGTAVTIVKFLKSSLGDLFFFYFADSYKARWSNNHAIITYTLRWYIAVKLVNTNACCTQSTKLMFSTDTATCFGQKLLAISLSWLRPQN